MQKAFKFRLYPTEEQCASLRIQFGHSRFVYNAALELRKDAWFSTQTSLSYEDTTKALAEFKRGNPELEWLQDADSQVLQQSLKDLDKAFERFFEMHKTGTLPPQGDKPRKDGMPKGYPTFKRKHDKQAIRYPQRFKVEGQQIYLPKVGWVQMVKHRSILGEMKNATVTRTKSGQYFISIQVEIQDKKKPSPPESEVGIDLGLKDFVTLSTGEKIAAPNHGRKMGRLLAIRQRRLSHKLEARKHRNSWWDKDKGDFSIRRASQKVATTHEKIANRRKDFHHQLSRRLVNEFGLIAFEDLNVKGMMQNHNLSRSIADAGWSQFVNFTTYKAGWAGVEIKHVDRFFPSSKTCSDCGAINRNLKLSDRSWVCLECGVVHDRDENAATNILKQATLGARGNDAEGHMSSAVRHSAPEKVLVTPATLQG